MKSLTLSFVLISFFAYSLADKCPFDVANGCYCVSDDPARKVFRQVLCKLSLGKFTPFKAARGAYTITGFLQLETPYDNLKLPASALEGFKSIGSIYIKNHDQLARTYNYEFDDAAFVGPKVDSFHIVGFRNMFPIPEAVRALGRQGLKELRVNYAETARLGDNEFNDFKSLTSLEIDRTTLDTVSDQAFVGLESTLQQLKLTWTKLQQYPGKAISTLTNLKVLDLTANEKIVTSIPKSAFSALTKLERLEMTLNYPLQKAIEAGAFDDLPSTVETVNMDGGELKDMPTDLLSKMPNVKKIGLMKNFITTVEKGHVPKGMSLKKLDLSFNPLRLIEQGALESLESLETLILKGINMPTFDLSVLAGANKLKELILDSQSGKLFKIVVTSPDQVPQSLNRITAVYAGLYSVDPQMEKILARKDFEVFDMTTTTDFKCEPSIKWMAKYEQCYGNKPRLITWFSNCGNLINTRISEYLKKIAPKPCQQ